MSRRSVKSAASSKRSQRSVSVKSDDSDSAASVVANRKALSLRSLNDCVAKGDGPHNIPIGTIIIIAVCVIIYIYSPDTKKFSLTSTKSCLGLYQLFYLQERMRFIACHFVHANIWELVFQMVSLLWKGHSLEKCCGPKYMILMILMLLPICSAAQLLVHKLMADYFDAAFITHCFYGFGSLNFALKVIKLYQTSDCRLQCAVGDYICMQAKHFAWLELAFSHVISSNTTIAAHFSGILVGLLFICGPLKILVDLAFNFLSGSTEGISGFKSMFGKAANIAVLTSGRSTPSIRRSEPALAQIKSSKSLRSVKSAESSS